MTGSGSHGDGAAVGRRIGQARRELGLTQAELATRIGVTLGILDRYETGRADPSGKLAQIAEVTGRHVSWFTSAAPYQLDVGDYETDLHTELGWRIAESVDRLGSAAGRLAETRVAARNAERVREDSHEDRVALVRGTEPEPASTEEQRERDEATARAGRLAEELARANANVEALAGQLEQSRAELTDARVQQDQLAGRVSQLESELQTSEKRAMEAKRRLDLAETELQVFRTRERSLVKELDLRQAELNVRAAELDTREIAVAHAEAKVGARTSALDNREVAVADAEAGAEDRLRALREMESRAPTRDGRRPAPPASEDELERHTGLLTGLSRRLDGLKRGAAVVEVERPMVRDDEHLVVAADHGYRLVVRQGPAAHPGALLELNGGLHRCLRIGRSPFLGDDRRCAVLEPVTDGAEAEPSSEPLVE
jgi:transcriptional regulator with XRE-family HTH domain